MTDIISKIKRKIYSKEAMLKALEAVKSGISINAASRLYNIPRSSIHRKVINKYSTDKPGPSSMLSDLEESDLVKWILFMSSRGCPVTKDQLINSVAMIVKKLNKPNPFVDDRPGRHWYAAFLKRHPELSKRMCENVTLSRALVSETSVRKWFQNIDDYLKKEQLQNIDSSRIFNTDETALMLNPKGSAVLAEKGSKNIYNIVNNNEKENVTVLVTANAAGQLAPTMVVFAYKRVPSSIYVTMPEEFCAGHSDKSWMTATLFFEYIANKFHPWLIKSGITLPVILYLDGHVSHLTQPLSEFCHLHQIILIALPPNTTHFLQPMDVSFFSPLKSYWKKMVNSYRIDKEILSVKKEDFSSLLKKVFDGMNLQKILSNGFKICGLYPFNVGAVDFLKVFIRHQNMSTENEQAATDIEINSSASFLENFDKYIDTNTLEAFRSNISNEWTGATEDKNLFYVWKKIQTDSRKNQINTFEFLDVNQASSPIEIMSEIPHEIEENKIIEMVQERSLQPVN